MKPSLPKSLAGVAVSALVAICATTSAKAADFDIGIIDSLTGAVAVAGSADVCGAKVATALVNDSGGVSGRKIALHVVDNQSNPAFAAQGASNLTGEGVRVFVGGSTSATVLSTLPIIKDAKGLHAGGTTKAQEILTAGTLAVRLNSDNSQDGASLASYLKDVLKAKRIVFASLQGAYGEGALASIKAGLGDGNPIVKTYFTPGDTTNFQSIITSISADKPDAVVFAIAGNTQPVAFMRQYKQAGIGAPLLAGTGVLTQSVAESAGGAADGVVSADLWLAEIDSPANAKLKDAFQKYKAGFSECSGKPLDKQVAITYSQVVLIAEAAKRAQSFEPEAIHKTLMSGDWDLPQGVVKFRKDGQALVRYYMIVGKAGTVAPLAR